ncbi:MULTISPECIES: aldehyde dehydrogenase family protein [Acinetobacter]|uniref:aldehyde dehydrogenase family protein n=1 Tax=Acinetobacter TaxID=469 RepID=UPI000BF8D895|nr:MULTISPECIES: aldehyde dehydrogenase family protein [Acinetobacter]MDC5293929.1 aldehyde dehydrogenase family protein [Acinetobacter baumannii]
MNCQTNIIEQVWKDHIFQGKWVKTNNLSREIINPATNEVISEVQLVSIDNVNKSVNIANEAQKLWKKTTFENRAKVLRKAAHFFEENIQTFIDWNVQECGSTLLKATWEANACIEQLYMAASMPMAASGEIFPSSIPTRTNVWQRVPLGVVGVISPWNFPLLLSIRSIAPALAMGNSVILKPSEFSNVTGGALLAWLFQRSGLPEGTFQVINGESEIGETLVNHPQVNMISFTGSTGVGKKIAETCAKQLKKCALELGGNNAMIICEDADVEVAVNNAVWGTFLHQGQICMQTGRHLVHRNIADLYIQKLKEKALSLNVGNPSLPETHLGPLINATQHQKVCNIVEEAIHNGARLECGGKGENLFFYPTIITNINKDDPIFTEEIFGPVAPILIFDDISEAIEIVNSSKYGLAVAIHTERTAWAYEIAKEIKSGMIHINDQTVNNEYHVPFGGMGESGYGGRFGGPANFDEFSQRQWVSILEKGIKYPL